MSDQCYFGGLTVSLKASKRFLEQIFTPKHKSQFGNVRIYYVLILLSGRAVDLERSFYTYHVSAVDDYFSDYSDDTILTKTP